jgi:hypothetical protein
MRVRVLGWLVCMGVGLAGVGGFWCSVAVAAPPETPELTVEVPVKAHEAMVVGVLNPAAAGEAGTYEFFYKASKTGVCQGGGHAPASPGISFGGEHEVLPTETLGGLTPGTEYAVCLRAEDTGGKTLSAPVSFTTALVPEAPAGEKARAVGTSVATLEGVLNPVQAGNPGTYEFVYRESGSECQGAGEKTAGGAMTGSKGQTVEAEVSGLLPNATYTFCLLARNEAGETALGPKVSFTTGAVKPSIEAEAITDITVSSAELTALVNPNGTATSYHFEYGTTTGYGASIPAAPAGIGAGRTGIKVYAVLPEREANETYHWRIVASNTAGVSTGPDETFVYPAGGGLSDGRGYELVTPPQKNGAVLSSEFGASGGKILPQVAENGASLLAVSIQCFDGPPSCTAIRAEEGEPYEFARTPTGWVTRPLAPPLAPAGGNSIWALNATEHTVLFSAPPAAGTPDDWYSRNGSGKITGIGPLGEKGNTLLQTLAGIAATSDLSHIVYGGTGLWTFGGLFEENESLYEYVGAGSTRPLRVGVSGGQGSSELISTCGTELGGNIAANPDQYNALSGSGRTVYFRARGGAGCVGTGAVNEHLEVSVNELFARVDGEGGEDEKAHTVALSEPQALTQGVREECKTAGCVKNTEKPVSPAVNPNWREAFFQGASSDGTRMLFTSEQQLTDQASQGEGENLYESECVERCETAGEARRLVDVSEAQGGKPAAGGPRVQGVMAISPEAGTHVYFVAESVLTGSEENHNHEKAENGKDNLYLYERDPAYPTGRHVFIGTLAAAADHLDWSNGVGQADVTPEGRFLVFESHRALTADDTRAEGPAQVYRYDAQTNTLIRVSIGQNGFNDNGNLGSGEAKIVLALHGFHGVGPVRADPTMSHNGEYVFFQSANALASGALNDVPTGGEEGGQKLLAQNIYEYHDGNVYLVSNGKDATEKSPTLAGIGELIGSDATGANVFFQTNDQLTPEDTDTQLDYYDAHLCTNAEPCIPPATQTAAAPCEEGACQTPTPPQPQQPLSGSNTFQGPGNLTIQPEAAAGAISVLTHTAHGTRFTLKVKSTFTAGQLTITATGIHAASRTLPAPGTYTLQITLTSAARHALHHKHKLTLKLHITYTPPGHTPTTSTTSLTLKP